MACNAVFMGKQVDGIYDMDPKTNPNAKRYENISTKILHRLGSGPQGIRIVEKGEMLKPYHFSICIENTEYSDYFTEKILDCFASGVIPIYWGTKNVQKYSNIFFYVIPKSSPKHTEII